MKIAYCGNYFAFDGLLISIISIMKHNKQTIDFYIITADLQNLNPSYKPITNEQILFLRSLIKSTNKMNSINFIDITQQYKNIFMKHNNSNPRFTPYANLRLLFDYVLPQDINKILYLDIDVICNNNLQEM
jgi:lipopolysaccharide biosynthesis glycosyltransferase